jgi:hypothetical protein
MRKIGNTSFREEAIKKMTLKEFRDTYTGLLKGQDVKKAYEDLTGKVSKEATPEPVEPEEPTAEDDFNPSAV